MSESVIIELTDLAESNNNLFSQLKRKFTNQQKGKCLWMKRRFEMPPEMQGFLPIEFAKDVSIVTRFLFDNLVNERSYSDTLYDIQSKLAKDVNFETNIFEYIVRNDRVIRNLIVLRGRKFVKESNIGHLLEIDRINESTPFVFSRDELDLVDLLIETKERPFLDLDEDLKKDLRVLKKLFKKDRLAYSNHLNEEFRTNREIIKEAILRNPRIYRFIDEKLKFDREIVTMTLERDGTMLEFVPVRTRFHSDIELASIAIPNNHKAFEFVSEKVKNQLESIYLINLEIYELKNCKTAQEALEKWTNSKFKYEKEIILQAVAKNHEIYFKLSPKWRQDEQVILEYIICCGEISQELYPYLNDWIVMEIINKAPNLFSSMPSPFRKDIHYEKLIEKELYTHCSIADTQNNYSIVMKIVKKDGLLLRNASEELRNDLEICKQAIYNNGKAFNHVGPLQENNYDLLMLSFLSKKRNSLYNLKNHLKNNPEIMQIARQFSRDSLTRQTVTSKFTKEEWIDFTIRKGYCISFSEELFNARLEFEYFGAKIY